MAKSRVGLEHLFGSDTRLKLLRIFLHNPEGSFYVRELVRRVGAQIHAIRRELMNLDKLGIIQEGEALARDPTIGSQRGPESQRKYFKVDTGHILYPELKALIIKSDLLAREDMVRRLRASGTISLLVLTGRFVGNNNAATDMLVVGLVNRKQIKDAVRKCEKSFGHEINYTVLSPREFKYRRELTDRFLYQILESKRIVLIDTGNVVPEIGQGDL